MGRFLTRLWCAFCCLPYYLKRPGGLRTQGGQARGRLAARVSRGAGPRRAGGPRTQGAGARRAGGLRTQGGQTRGGPEAYVPRGGKPEAGRGLAYHS